MKKQMYAKRTGKTDFREFKGTLYVEYDPTKRRWHVRGYTAIAIAHTALWQGYGRTFGEALKDAVNEAIDNGW